MAGMNVGTAYLTIMPSARGFARHLRKELGETFTVMEKDITERIEQGAKKSRIKDIISKSLDGIKFAGLATAISAAIGPAVTLASALLPLGGFLTAVPALALGAGAALGTLTLAMKGVGDALGAGMQGDAKKYEKALDELAPAARTVVKGLVDTFQGLQGKVQQAFFKPLGNSTKVLSANLKGPLTKGMTSVAKALGGMASRVVEFASSSSGIETVNNAFKATKLFIRGASDGIKPLLQGFTDLANVMFPSFEGAGVSLGKLMTKFGNFMSDISRGGKALGWLDQAKEVFGSLFRIVKNLGVAILNIFKASDQGGDMLKTIEDITAALAEWTGSVEGQEKLGAVFALLGQILRDLMTILPGVAGVIGTIAAALNSLPAPVRGVISQMLAWSVVIGALSGPIGMLITAVGLAGTGFKKFDKRFPSVLIKLKKFGAAVLAASVSAVKAAGRAVASAAIWAVQTVASVARAIAAYVALQAAALRAGVVMLAQWVRSAAAAVAGAAVQVGQLALVGAKWIWMGIVSMAAGIKAAAAWVMSLGPIGLIIAAIAAIIAAIVAVFVYWEEISTFFSELWANIWEGLTTAWDAIIAGLSAAWEMIWANLVSRWTAISEFFSLVWENIWAGISSRWASIMAFFGAVWAVITGIFDTAMSRIEGALNWFAELPGLIGQWIGGMVTEAINRFGALVAYARSIPAKIKTALGNVKTFLVEAGRNIIQGLLNGIKNAAGAVWDWISGFLGGIKDQVLSFFGIASPSKLFTYYGEMIGAGLVKGLDSMSKHASRAADRLAEAAVPNFQTQFAMSGTLYPTPAPSERTLSDEDTDRLAEALAARPFVATIDSREIYRASDAGRRKDNRRM